MDRQWIKILAESQLQDGFWKPSNPAAAREHSRQLLQRTVLILFQEMKEATLVFNEHSRREKKLSIFPVYSKEKELMTGFVLVVGRLQLQLAQTENTLEVLLSRLQGFHQTSKKLHELSAHVDPFGGISWIMDENSIMTEDMIAKQLLHDLCREAHASEWC